MDDFKKKYSADSATAIVVDPMTGEIFVWAQNPRTQKEGTTVRNLACHRSH